jgi:hypothetical protein
MNSRHARIVAALVVVTLAASLPPAVAAQAAPPAAPPSTSPQAPSAVAAPAQIDPFQSRVAQAAQLLDSDPQAAAEQLDHLAVESTEMRKIRALTPAERTTHRQLFTLRARAHLELMNNQNVEESLRELLRVDPFFTTGLAPRLQEILDGLRTRESGLLEVSSPVRDCKILLDGLEIGVTGDVPVRVSLIAGTYQLRLEKPGYQGAGARLTMVPAQTLSVTDLAPRAQIPPIAFLTDRAGVEVLVDNAPAGTTTALAELRTRLTMEEAAALDQAVSMARFDARTSAGFLLRNPPVDRSMSLRFRGECLIEETRSIAITAEALAGLDPSSPLVWFGDSSAVRMRPDVGTLRVTSTPRDADVYVDGALAGRTPFERSVCAGAHRVRVRHRIGSYGAAATVSRGRTEVIDITLRPGLGFLGAVETASGMLRPAPELASTIDSALASAVSSFRLAAPAELPPEILPWSDASNAELIAAADGGNSDKLKRLLRQASENFDAPLLLSAVARGPAGSDAPVDLLLFWFEHDGVDRVRVPRVTSEALGAVLSAIDRPADPADLVYQNDLGMRMADTLLGEAPLLVVSVEPGTPAAVAGIKAGDAILSVDGGTLSATQVAELARQKRPGDVLTVRVQGAGQARQLTIPVQRRARRTPVFNLAHFGNSVMAKLQAALAVATSQPERDLLAFNTALVHMRFRQWRAALDTFGAIGQVPTGIGVGPGVAVYFRARCHEALGERDRALALLREVAADTQPIAEDGTTVGTLVRLRLGPSPDTTRPPVR